MTPAVHVMLTGGHELLVLASYDTFKAYHQQGEIIDCKCVYSDTWLDDPEHYKDCRIIPSHVIAFYAY